MMLLAAVATLWIDQPGRPMVDQAPTVWVQFHILISVVTYGLLTIGAISGFAVVLQERALKRKNPAVCPLLPSVADGEQIQVSLLATGGTVLACGLLSGMAAEFSSQEN